MSSIEDRITEAKKYKQSIPFLVLMAILRGLPVHDIAKIYDVPESTVNRIAEHCHTNTGDTSYRQWGYKHV